MQFTMRFSSAALFVLTATAQSNLPTLPQAVQNLPSCSYSALKSAMADVGCDPSSITGETFNCMCIQHFVSVVDEVSTSTNYECPDFPTNFGTMCGVYDVGPPQSDIDSAVTALQNELGGQGSATSTVASSTVTNASTKTGGTVSSSAAAKTASTTSSSALAAAPTMIDIGGVLGPVVVAAVAMLV